MEPQLTFLATTHEPNFRQRIDKYLVGYQTIQFMERGGVSLSYDDREYRLEGVWFWPAYPGPLTRFHAAPGYDSWYHRHVGFTGPLVSRWIAAGLWPDSPQPAPPGKNYSQFFDELIRQARRTDVMGRLRATNLLEQLLLELAEDRAQPTRDQPWLDQVLAHLEQTDNFVPQYDQIASDVAMGLSTLRRRFKAAMGVSLHTYVLQSRLATARTLLSETDMPIKAIAEKLGYDTVYFFSGQFRQNIGISPAAYRKSRQSRG